MNVVKHSPRLYFSLLPSHLNKYFVDTYLPRECDNLWHRLSTICSPNECKSCIDPDNEACAKYSARKGYIAVLKDLLDKENPNGLDRDFMRILYEYAAMENRIDVVKWLQNTYTGDILDDATYAAVQYGSLDTIKYMYYMEGSLRKDIWTVASTYGHIHILSWLMEEHPKIVHSRRLNKYQGAIRGGRIDVIKWIHEAGLPWEDNILSRARTYKRQRLVKWLLSDEYTEWLAETTSNQNKIIEGSNTP